MSNIDFNNFVEHNIPGYFVVGMDGVLCHDATYWDLLMEYTSCIYGEKSMMNVPDVVKMEGLRATTGRFIYLVLAQTFQFKLSSPDRVYDSPLTEEFLNIWMSDKRHTVLSDPFTWIAQRYRENGINYAGIKMESQLLPYN